jgi:hypothetical protein
MTEETGQYRFDSKELAAAYKQFCDWLSRHAGEDAAKCFRAIWFAEMYTSAFEAIPESQLLQEQKQDIKCAINDLARAIKWLKEQEDGTVELCPWAYISDISPRGE